MFNGLQSPACPFFVSPSDSDDPEEGCAGVDKLDSDLNARTNFSYRVMQSLGDSLGNGNGRSAFALPFDRSGIVSCNSPNRDTSSAAR